MVIITGSDLSGSNGGTNRTYTITDSNFDSNTLQIFVSGTYAYQGSGKDYTLSGQVVTFLNATFNAQTIEIRYSTTSSTTTPTSYGTTIQLARFMGIDNSIPDKALVGENRVKETVGTGDSSTTRFFLDHAFVIAGTYTIYSGATEPAATALTETTDYVLDKDNGEITLTATGVTTVGTNNIYAEYSYTRNNITDTQLSSAITRAAEQIDSWTNNHFVDDSVATPSWDKTLDEVHDGAGAFRDDIFTLQKYPCPNVTTLVNGAITADDTTITVDSTSGFPSTGYLGIEDDKIQYTGKTSTTFTGCTSVSAHDDDTTVTPYVIEMSTTEPGGTISWDILKDGTEYELDHNTGRIHIYATGKTYDGTYIDVEDRPLKGVASRFRFSYLSGFTGIPQDIVKATLMLAAKDIMGMVVRQSHSTGLNDFDPGLLNVDQDELMKTLSRYRNEQYKRIG